MSRDYLAQEATQMRRTDRDVNDDAWIKDFLRSAAVGALATVYDGQPFVNTNLFVYDEASNSIIAHTARVGRTRANIEEHDRVCFSVMEMGRLLPAEEALEFSVEYAGVTVFGRMRIVSDEGEATAALQMLLDKYAPHLMPGIDYRGPKPDELRRTTVFRLEIESWSGKLKEAPADFAGAFFYDDQPALSANKAACANRSSV